MLSLKQVGKERKDGSAEYTWEADEEFFTFYKKETGRTKILDKEVGEFILKYITDIVGEEPTPKTNNKKKKKKAKKK
jgi:hypothetical protein